MKRNCFSPFQRRTALWIHVKFVFSFIFFSSFFLSTQNIYIYHIKCYVFHHIIYIYVETKQTHVYVFILTIIIVFHILYFIYVMPRWALLLSNRICFGFGASFSIEFSTLERTVDETDRFERFLFNAIIISTREKKTTEIKQRKKHTA